LQLAAGGGVMPIELSGGFFQSVHEWLPFTWVIKAFRTSLFGAFNHGGLEALVVVVAGGVVSLLLAAWVGKWKVVPAELYKPGIDV
jgi:putative membrane protein